MTSKKSFLVNLKTNARRRIWLIVVMFLGFLFSMTVLNAMTLSMEKMYYGGKKHLAEHLGRVFARNIGLNVGMSLFISAVAVIAAVQGFSYMYQRKKLDLYMSVPVTQNRRFAAIYVNGFFAFFVPYLCNVLLSFLVAKAMGADISMALGEAAVAVFGNTVLYLAVYHTTILAVMLTGNLIVTLMGTAVLLFYDGIVYVLHITYMSTFFNSFYYRTEVKLQNYLYSPVIRFIKMIGDCFTYKGYGYERVFLPGKFLTGIIPVAVAAVLTLLLALWCYHRKPAEACGKAMVFPKTKAVIKILVTVQAGLAGGIIFYGLSGNSILFLILGLIAGTLLCHGIIEVIYDFDIRSVRNGWKSLLIAAAGVAVIFCMFQFDVIHYDSYVPAPEQVDHIAFSFTDEYYNNYYDEKMQTIDRDEYIFDNMQITDISPLLQLAEKRMGTETEDNRDCYRFCVIRYQLKNGDVIYRQFPTVYREDTELLDEIVTDTAYQKGCSTVYNEPFLELGNRLKIYYDNGSSGRIETKNISAEKLINAYRQDLQNFSFTDMLEKRASGKLQLECVEQGVYVYISLPVYPKFEHTIALLREEGVYSDTYLELDNVEQIIVRNSNSSLYDAYIEDNEYGESSYADFETEAVFDDPAEIKQIAAAVYPEAFTEFWVPQDTLNTDYYVTVVYKKALENADGYVGGYYMIADCIPDFVKEKTAYTGEN